VPCIMGCSPICSCNCKSLLSTFFWPCLMRWSAMHRPDRACLPCLPACLPSCREQIVGFILSSTQGAVQAPSGAGYVDPYTGASAYVPPTTSGFGGGSSGGGGGSGAVTGGGADPFTGGGGGGAAPPRHIPAKAYLIYDQVGAGWCEGASTDYLVAPRVACCM
jgi:hypothetical protein